MKQPLSGPAMDRDMTVSARSWAISACLHGGLLIAMMLALGAGSRVALEEPVARLVYVEPAPPAAPPLGTAGRAAPVVEPAPVPPVVETAPPAPRVAERKKAPRAQPAEVPDPPPPRPDAAAPTGNTQGVAGGAGDTMGGVAVGTAGGMVGGLGTAPLGLRDAVTPPVLVDRVLPEYPPLAREREIDGQVVLEVVLDESGRVEDEIRVLRSLPLLDEAAIAAVRRWRFRPARDRDGRPVRIVMEIPVRFVLR